MIAARRASYANLNENSASALADLVDFGRALCIPCWFRIGSTAARIHKESQTVFIDKPLAAPSESQRQARASSLSAARAAEYH